MRRQDVEDHFVGNGFFDLAADMLTGGSESLVGFSADHLDDAALDDMGRVTLDQPVYHAETADQSDLADGQRQQRVFDAAVQLTAGHELLKAVTPAQLLLQFLLVEPFALEYLDLCFVGRQRIARAVQLGQHRYPVRITTEAVTLTANFQKTLTVTLNQAEGGTATITPTDKAVGHTETTVTGLDDSSGNMVATLTATANDGYAFSGWKVTYLKNGKETDANAKGANKLYHYVIDGKLSDDSIKVGFNDNPTKMYAIYHVSLIVTPQFTKQLDVTIEQSEGGTVTSSDALTSLASGAQVTLTATPNEGYGVLGWNVTDVDGNATSDYTLKMANDTATITLGNTSLKVSAQFSTDAGKFVVDPTEKNPPTAMLRDVSTSIQNGATTVSGWNNNKNEELVMTIIPTQDPRTTANANLYMGIWRLDVSGYAKGTELKFPDDVVLTDSSASSNYKLITFKADCAHPWEEIPFTITDVNGNVKQAKIVLDYPSKGTISIEGTGKVTVNGSEYVSGDVVKAVTGAELTLQATEASTFAGWEVTGMTLTEEQAKANPLTITAPEGSFTIKAKFQKTLTVTLEQAEGGTATITPTDKAVGYCPRDFRGLSGTIHDGPWRGDRAAAMPACGSVH